MTFASITDNDFDGWMSGNFVENLWPKYEDGYSWFRVFGVFFPTVTGVLSGINMSGDLRAPSTDIPNGTLAAFGTSLVIFNDRFHSCLIPSLPFISFAAHFCI